MEGKKNLGHCNFARMLHATWPKQQACTSGSGGKFLKEPCSTSVRPKEVVLVPLLPWRTDVEVLEDMRHLSWNYAFSMTAVIRLFPFQVDLYCSGTGISM